MAGANFGDTIMEGAIAPEVQQQAPVVDKSGLYLAEAASSGLQGIGTVFGGMVKGAMAAEANTALVGYRQDVSMIADAMDQGQLTPAAGRMRMRQLYGDYLANNPHLAEDLDKLNSTLLSENGIGHVIQTGNEQVQRDIALADSAFAAGWVGPSGQPDVAGYTNFQQATRALETQKKDIELRSAQLGYTSEVDKAALTSGLNKWASAGLPWVDTQIANAAALIDGGANAADVLLKLKADIGTVTGNLSAGSEGVNIDHIIEPINSRMAIFEDVVRGTTTTAMMTEQIATIGAQQKYALIQSDPEVARLVAISELFGAGASQFVNMKLTEKSIQLMAGAIAPFDSASDSNPKPPDLIGSDGNIAAALDTAKELLTKAAEAPTPGQTTEVNNLIINAMRSLKAYNGDTVKDYRSIVDFFADPSVAKWVGNGSLVVPADLQDQAKAVIERQYGEVLLPLVEEQWTTAQQNVAASANRALAASGSLVGGDSSALGGDIADVIKPVWNGSSVSFQAAPGFEGDAYVKSVIDGLNNGENGIAAPLNTLIRAQAHMNGNTDYAAQYNILAERLFPEAGIAADVNKMLDATDPNKPDTSELDLSVFNEDVVASYIAQEAPDISAAEYDDLSGTLIGFEGFSASPYWDVNAYRVGFGSDTITQADGSVVKVRPGMTVTKEDAQRDLTRRLNEEFIPGVVRDVGGDAWSILPPAAQTAIASIAYNYGGVGPNGANLVAAIQTGDLETIAKAVERLKSHNNGVNANRRQKEANMIRSAA